MDEFEHIPMVNQPRNLTVDLFPHQLASIHSMERLERDKRVQIDYNSYMETRIGVSSDETGYGKTLALIGLVLRDKMEWGLNDDYENILTTSYSNHHVREIVIEKYPRNDVTLVLVGPSVISQWENEFSRTNLAVVSLKTSKEVNTVNVDDYNVVIVTLSLYNRLIERFKGIVWKRFIFDEPGHLRVSSMQHIRAGFVWLVSATPNAIFSKHINCRSSYITSLIEKNEYVFKRIIEHISVKNDNDFVHESFKMPATHHTYHKCYSQIHNIVKGLVNSKITYLIDVGDISTAIKILGGKKTDSISDLVKKKMETELSEIQKKIDIWSMRCDDTRIKIWTGRKNRIIKSIDELDRRIKNTMEGNCSICQDKLHKPIMEPGCQNVFCGKCLLMWLQKKNTCPLCRSEIDTEELTYIITDGSDVDDYESKNDVERITKNDTIASLIENKPDGKFIIYSMRIKHLYQFGNIFLKIRSTFLKLKDPQIPVQSI